jgi:glucosyl-dolichyl phosphate glucuronosyltransferase
LKHYCMHAHLFWGTVETSNRETAFRPGVSNGTAVTQPSPPLDMERQASPVVRYDVSVVVPTFNRQLLLGRTLESLLHQQSGGVRYEVLVVDNNSADGTRSVVEAFANRWSAVRYLFEPRCGVSHARNTGIAAARAPLIAFIDDDVEASPTWIATIKRVFDERPGIDCIGGRIDARWATPPPAWLTPQHWGAVALQREKGDSPYVDADHASPCLMTANFASRRAALDEVGGFSPDFLRDEDRELQLRLWTAGKHGLYVDELAVTTEVPADRMTKSYHRQFHLRNGRTQARMRFRDRLARDGRLVQAGLPSPRLLGTPAYLYRNLLGHVAGWFWHTLTFDRTTAFFHETRALYYASYAWSRYRQQKPALWAVPWEFVRFASAVVSSRFRARAGA